MNQKNKHDKEIQVEEISAKTSSRKDWICLSCGQLASNHSDKYTTTTTILTCFVLGGTAVLSCFSGAPWGILYVPAAIIPVVAILSVTSFFCPKCRKGRLVSKNSPQGLKIQSDKQLADQETKDANGKR